MNNSEFLEREAKCCLCSISVHLAKIEQKTEHHVWIDLNGLDYVWLKLDIDYLIIFIVAISEPLEFSLLGDLSIIIKKGLLFPLEL